MSKVIGIIGSRRRDGLADLAKVERAFKSIYQVGDTIVSGGCPQGGDRFAEILACHTKISTPFVPNFLIVSSVPPVRSEAHVAMSISASLAIRMFRLKPAPLP